MNEVYHRVCCPTCGAEISRSVPGSKALVTCGKCRSRLLYEVNAGGPRVEVVQLRTRNETQSRQ